MPTNKQLNVKDLKLDLKNYRTVPQKSEEDAINAMIAIKPERFYAVVESIIENGYLPTENILILQNHEYTVKEGNRRTAALKLIHGIHSKDNFNLPDSLIKQIEKVDAKWKKENSQIPCSIYPEKEKKQVDKIVNLTHAKGEKASRDAWTSVAKARQNRDEKKGSEPTLDLLEKYLKEGQNLTQQQKERWSGDYPLTVLEEALRTIIKRINYNSIAELTKAFPKIKHRKDLENLIRDIGLQVFGFKEIRSKTEDFAAAYNIPVDSTNSQHTNTTQPNNSTSTNQGNQHSASQDSSMSGNGTQATSSASNGGKSTSNTSTGNKSTTGTNKTKAYAIHDQRNVTQTLKKFNPKGNDRQKLVTLRDELKKLKVKSNPIAFCFILRSMFEISAKIYCKENSIPTTQTKGSVQRDKSLKQLLSAVTTHLTSNNSNHGMVKVLHGANSELAKTNGFLSVTSMNQLVHNPSFSIAPHDIFTLFNNVYPLLEAMN